MFADPASAYADIFFDNHDDIGNEPAADTSIQLTGVESGRGRNHTLRMFPMPFDDVGDGVLADAEVACDPTVAPPPVDGMEHLRGEAV